MTIEGIPDGWELVRIGQVIDGEYYLGMNGKILFCEGVFDGKAYVVIRKIEKPKQYRAFANAAEFMSHPLHDGWINIGTVGFTKVCKFTDTNFWIHGEIVTCRWEEGFEFIKFRDGSPFGVEVKDE